MRLIDADALDDVVTRLNAENWGITVADYKIIDRVMFEFPTVDTPTNTPTNTPNTPTDTPIVRCRECIWRMKDGTCARLLTLGRVAPDDYCSKGNRGTKGADDE